MAEIKYVEVPIRVKPHQDYLDMKGVEELWVKIKEYVREHGGEGGTVVGAVDEVEVNRIIREYYESHKNDLKGDPFTFADFTEEQLADLKIKGDKGEQGEKGDPFTYEDFTEEQLASLKGEKGDKGQDGTITFEELTEEQKATLKGEKGDVGAPFTYDMFTEAQLAALKGEKGDKGQDGTMVFEDLTDEQRATLKGEKGDRGEKGDTGAPFTYDMFTPEQLEALKVKGDKGDQGERGEKGDQGIQGIQGVQGVPGRAGEVDYTLVYRKSETYSKTEIDDKLKNVDFDIDLGELGNIDLDNYYDKAEIDTKFAAIEIEGATGVHLGDTEPDNPLVTIWVDTDGIAYNGDEDIHELFYTKDEIDYKMENYKHNLSEMVNDIGFITEGDIPTRTSDLNNDAGFLTSQDAYTKGTVYTKDEIHTLLAGFEPDTDFEMHDHANIGFLDKIGEKDGKLTYNGEEIVVGSVDLSDLDLSSYATQTALNNGLALKADKDHTHDEYVTAEDIVDITGGKLISSMTYTYAYGADSKTKPTQWFATKTEASNAYTTQTYSWVKQTTTFSDGTSEEGFFVTMNTVNVPSEYVTETELANKKYLTAVPSEYITESELNAKGYLTAVPTHTHSQYLTEVPSEYITETELNNKNYTTKTYVDNAIANIDTSGSGGGSGSGVGQTYGDTTAGEIFNDYTNNTAAEMAHAEGLTTKATGIRSHAEGQSTESSGVASHAEGTSSKASGHSSHAEGSENTASGQNSHAEGWKNTASGAHSHAEGSETKAGSSYAHAEGYKTQAVSSSTATPTSYSNNVNGTAVHAEGYGTVAYGTAAHAEGNGTMASGFSSHSEGRDTVASGSMGHAEGFGTIAAGNNQHAQGRWNVEDTDSKYAHIVGNGTSSARSNAHTLDWDGNAWFKGNVYVGGTSMDDATLLGSGGGSVDLSGYYTKAETDTAISTAISGIPTGGGSSENWEEIYNFATSTFGFYDNIETKLNNNTMGKLADYSKVRFEIDYKSYASFCPAIQVYTGSTIFKCVNTSASYSSSSWMGQGYFIGEIEDKGTYYLLTTNYIGEKSSKNNWTGYLQTQIAPKAIGFTDFKVVPNSTPSSSGGYSMTAGIKMYGVRK